MAAHLDGLDVPPTLSICPASAALLNAQSTDISGLFAAKRTPPLSRPCVISAMVIALASLLKRRVTAEGSPFPWNALPNTAASANSSVFVVLCTSLSAPVIPTSSLRSSSLANRDQPRINASTSRISASIFDSSTRWLSASAWSLSSSKCALSTADIMFRLRVERYLGIMLEIAIEHKPPLDRSVQLASNARTRRREQRDGFLAAGDRYLHTGMQGRRRVGDPCGQKPAC